MPTCKKCDDQFPYATKHEGKRVSLRGRSYCPKCVPIGTRYKPSDDVEPNRVCTVCEKPYVYMPQGRNTPSKCITCITRERRHSVKKKAIELLGGKCQVCGYDRCQRAMHFHHLDPSLKSFSISSFQNSAWSLIEAELTKCVLLCSNCHAEVEDGIIKVGGGS